MIELRWIKRKEVCGNDGFYAILRDVKVLQYREMRYAGPPGVLIVPMWSEWKDIPIVEEEDD